MDELIKQYAMELNDIYMDRTAGSYTFEGVLSSFLRAVESRNDDD